MKTILFYFLLTILAVSCQLKQSENTEKEVSDNVSNSDTEECIADTISATAIFWIDKHKEMPGQPSKRPGAVRTVKAKVNIHLAGRIEVLSYVKPQKGYIKSYINRRLETFRVRKVLMDSAYIKPGVQYVQLRYTPEKVEH